MAEMQNVPTPGLIYPKSSGLYLMSRVQELTANVADLIETLCQRDRQIAEQEQALVTLKARVAELEQPAPLNVVSKANGATTSA